MIRLEIDEARRPLSRCLAELEPGEVIVLCRRGVPIAEIRGLPRPIGLARGRIEVPADCSEPLPEGVLAAFEDVV